MHRGEGCFGGLAHAFAPCAEFVFNLAAPDAFLRQRELSLPESEVAHTHNTEDGFTRRLARFRELNTEDDTVLNFFDELEIHPLDIGAGALLLAAAAPLID